MHSCVKKHCRSRANLSDFYSVHEGEQNPRCGSWMKVILQDLIVGMLITNSQGIQVLYDERPAINSYAAKTIKHMSALNTTASDEKVNSFELYVSAFGIMLQELEGLSLILLATAFRLSVCDKMVLCS